ncbi:thioredoxin family protein [Staphylococcus pseudintermedius]|uniref:thioredoxin family protein n=1 Tax=Staphylococcus pseudintermedius TaxID=283734 RepID=UPI0018F2F9F6|nr:thioredoxin family protein [Staphylococcus pseudintermedius]MBJ8208411.1 thioredoxin family protein [Staphylococcus pseudintermedius]MCE5745770.1 thioredoxin family protein [Staphylococcus pseudintermedius]
MSVSKQLNNISKHFDQSVHLIFGYTPMCGTCKIAERMLDISNEITQLPIVKLDLNYHPEWSQEKEIQSVPILIIMRYDQEVERLYAFHSVPYLLEKLKKSH